ncbi:MAG: hypothetical protein DYG92_12090 [Leptolyngbya sp. PLA1]|nr:hypothetical protein [Leptolyngbya sp. PLA1]
MHTVPEATARVHRLVPFAHVADVEASLRFYALLGFERQSDHKGPAGRTVWAHAKSGTAEIMLAQADGPIDAGAQGVLFYMYSDDVEGLRAHLLASGVADGGAYHGQPGPGVAAGPGGVGGAVFEVMRPFYMPSGQLRVHDPDGYVCLVGQVG